jgi:hypothetical protein
MVGAGNIPVLLKGVVKFSLQGTTGTMLHTGEGNYRISSLEVEI